MNIHRAFHILGLRGTREPLPSASFDRVIYPSLQNTVINAGTPSVYFDPPLFYILLLCCLYYLCIVRGRQYTLALEGVGRGVWIRGKGDRRYHEKNAIFCLLLPYSYISAPISMLSVGLQ